MKYTNQIIRSDEILEMYVSGNHVVISEEKISFNTQCILLNSLKSIEYGIADEYTFPEFTFRSEFGEVIRIDTSGSIFKKLNDGTLQWNTIDHYINLYLHPFLLNKYLAIIKSNSICTFNQISVSRQGVRWYKGIFSKRTINIEWDNLRIIMPSELSSLTFFDVSKMQMKESELMISISKNMDHLILKPENTPNFRVLIELLETLLDEIDEYSETFIYATPNY